jgi:hypothetical protein
MSLLCCPQHYKAGESNASLRHGPSSGLRDQARFTAPSHCSAASSPLPGKEHVQADIDPERNQLDASTTLA